MTILTRYLVRSLVGPFLFSFLAVTGLLFLTAIAQRFQELAGKGVGAGVIVELMLLSLPHVVTFSVPMAFFAATLYVFSDLTQNRELVVLASAGVHPLRLLLPLSVVGLALSLLMVKFNDGVLAGANTRFLNRLDAVARMSPTLNFREGVVNTLRPADGSTRYIWVRSLERERGQFHGVTIVDLSRSDRSTYMTAEEGTVEVRPNGRDLLLWLNDGQISSAYPGTVESFRTTRFERLLIVVRDVITGLETGGYQRERAERELSIATLRARIENAPAPGVSARYRGELHRRFATAFACLVFALLAPALGMWFAHGGTGAVIKLSVGVIVFFRVGVIIGDRLVDAGRVDPVLGSWGTVILLLAGALPLLWGTRASIAQRTPGPTLQ